MAVIFQPLVSWLLCLIPANREADGFVNKLGGVAGLDDDDLQELASRTQRLRALI